MERKGKQDTGDTGGRISGRSVAGMNELGCADAHTGPGVPCESLLRTIPRNDEDGKD
jgi:hypothetical protein